MQRQQRGERDRPFHHTSAEARRRPKGALPHSPPALGPRRHQLLGLTRPLSPLTRPLSPLTGDSHHQRLMADDDNNERAETDALIARVCDCRRHSAVGGALPFWDLLEPAPLSLSMRSTRRADGPKRSHCALQGCKPDEFASADEFIRVNDMPTTLAGFGYTGVPTAADFKVCGGGVFECLV